MKKKANTSFLFVCSHVLAFVLVSVGNVPVRSSKFSYIQALHVKCRSRVDHQLAIICLHNGAIKVAEQNSWCLIHCVLVSRWSHNILSRVASREEGKRVPGARRRKKRKNCTISIHEVVHFHLTFHQYAYYALM